MTFSLEWDRNEKILSYASPRTEVSGIRISSSDPTRIDIYIYMPGTERAMKREDCLSCRVVGTAACLGSSAYIAFHTQGKRGLHKTIGVVASAGLVVMGVIRAFVS